MSDPRDPSDEGVGDDLDLDQTEDLEPEVEEAEAGEEPVAEVEEEDEPEPQPRQTRGPRGRPNGEEIRELRSQNERLQQQFAELQRQQQASRVDPAAQRAQEDAFFEQLELLQPREAYRALWQRAQQQLGQQFAQQSLTTQEAIDRQHYESQARSSRVHEQYRQRVEDLVANERARGNIVGREVALKFLLGEDAINRANRVVPGQRRAAAARVGAQTVRPATGRGDVSRGGGGRRDPDADDARLLREITAGDI